MTRKVTASCFRTRLLLLPTLSNRLPRITHVHIHPLLIGDKTPKPSCSGMCLALRLFLPREIRACLFARMVSNSTHRAFPLQRTMLCCAQYILAIEKGKNVLLVRVLFRSRALNRIRYPHLYVKHRGVDTMTGCSIACPYGTCQVFFNDFFEISQKARSVRHPSHGWSRSASAASVAVNVCQHVSGRLRMVNGPREATDET